MFVKYLHVNGIHQVLFSFSGQCLECEIQTTKLCQQCNTIICEQCFDKSHKSFVVFKTHILKEIQAQKISNNCMIHFGKFLDYYCRDCKKSVCLDCLMVGSEKSCKKHDIVLISEMASYYFQYEKQCVKARVRAYPASSSMEMGVTVVF